MLGLLREFYRDKAAMRQSHASAARFVSDYNFNNTYQYVIAREDMHVRWLADARLDAIPWTRVCITCKEKQKA